MRMWMIVAALLLASSAMADDALKDCVVRGAAQLNFSGVAYAGRGTDVVEQAFGTADSEGKVPVSATTRFNIGSAGKMFTAVAIGQLIDRGVVSLDAPVGTYLKELRPEIAKVTVRQLLAHTSGLGDYLKPANLEAIQKARTATALLPLAVADTPAFPPGGRFAYSNSGYVVLGAVIERVTHESYGDYLAKEIFAAAGMPDTALDTAGSAAPMTRMSPAGPLPKPVLSPLRLSFASPAGGEIGTAADMARFLDALNQGRLVTAATKAALFAPQASRGGDDKYALGFAVSPGPPLKVGHGGGAPGINAEIALFPDSGWKVVTLSNGDPPAASQLATLIERVLFASDKAAACSAALSDPAFKPGSPPHPAP